MKSFKNDTKAQAGAMDMVLGVAVGLVILAAVFSVAPLIGSKIDSAASIASDDVAAVAADGTLYLDAGMSDEDMVNITISGTTTVFELDGEGNFTAGHVQVSVIDYGASTAITAFASAINLNATVNGSVTAADAVGNTMTLTADATGTAGNSIGIDETGGVTSYWLNNATSLSGGVDAVTASAWGADTVPTGVDIWSDNASLLGLVVLVIIIGLAIFYIRSMGGAGGV